MARDFEGIICLLTGKLLDGDNDPYCVNHWQDLLSAKKGETGTRRECIASNCCVSLDQLKRWKQAMEIGPEIPIFVEEPDIKDIQMPKSGITRHDAVLSPVPESKASAVSKPKKERKKATGKDEEERGVKEEGDDSKKENGEEV